MLLIILAAHYKNIGPLGYFNNKRRGENQSRTFWKCVFDATYSVQWASHPIEQGRRKMSKIGGAEKGLDHYNSKILKVG